MSVSETNDAKIEEEIDYKVGKWKCEMERGFKKVDFLYPIFGYFPPLKKRGKITLLRFPKAPKHTDPLFAFFIFKESIVTYPST